MSFWINSSLTFSYICMQSWYIYIYIYTLIYKLIYEYIINKYFFKCEYVKNDGWQRQMSKR